MKYQDAISSEGVVKPELYPVSATEISDMASSISFPPELVECWLQIGCGFFSRDGSGDRLTTFQNRLVGPDEILDLKEGGVFPEDDPFAVGTPFFETADMRYLVLKSDGSVAHQSGVWISDSLESFIRSVVEAPEFWLTRLRFKADLD